MSLLTVFQSSICTGICMKQAVWEIRTNIFINKNRKEMKKIKYLAMLLFVALVSVAAVSCGDDNESGTDGGGGGGGTEAETLTPNEQKVKLEKVARKLVGKVDADQFSNIEDMAKGIEDTDDSAISDWADACMDACLPDVKGDSVYSYLYAASNFTGSFELKDGKWTKSDEKVNYLQFKFNDNAGKNCVLKLEHSGKETTVHHESFDDEYYCYGWNGYYYTKYLMSKDKISYSVPENIKVTLTQGGTTVASTDIRTTLSVGSGDVDITRDGAEVTMTTTVNDYKFVLQKAVYSKGKSASVPSFVVTKGGEELISLTANATGDLSDVDDPVLKTGSFEVKVLGGEARVVGNLTDGQTLKRCLDNAYDNDEYEEEFKKYINQANSLIDVKLYLDNSDKYAALLRLQPFEEYYYSAYSSWDAKPVLVFGDGSSYSFDEYFDKNTFNTVINKVENLIDDFIRMFDN